MSLISFICSYAVDNFWKEEEKLLMLWPFSKCMCNYMYCICVCIIAMWRLFKTVNLVIHVTQVQCIIAMWRLYNLVNLAVIEFQNVMNNVLFCQTVYKIYTEKNTKDLCSVFWHHICTNSSNTLLVCRLHPTILYPLGVKLLYFWTKFSFGAILINI